jgi:hypothetical protein
VIKGKRNVRVINRKVYKIARELEEKPKTVGKKWGEEKMKT